MKSLIRFISLFLILFFISACGPKKLKPGEPTTTPPPTTTPAQPPPPAAEPPVETPKPQPPPPPAKPPLVVPQMKPRQPSKADPASTKLMDAGAKQLNAGNLDQAEELFEQALRVSPTNGKPYYYLGVIASRQKDYERALGFLQQAETYLHTDNFWMSQVLYQEGLTLKAMKRIPEAKKKFQEALQRDPNNQYASKELKTLGTK
ncbi:tetratricopeptide repeat protein [bacterium]|nr:tetratricopeptide repeat protein [bacterium]